MIRVPRSALTEENSQNVPATCILGIGNAGVALMDSLTLSGMANGARLVAVNTDSVSLGSSVVSEKILIGQQTTRGLGSGGDPELGAKAAEEAEAALSVILEGAGAVILCCGLGGGTGSGAATVAAELAKRMNAFVVALVTLPFSFEGKRRERQASDALHDLAASADVVFAFENDRLSEISAPMAGIRETFAVADETLSSTVGALMRLLTGSGPLRANLSDIGSLFVPSGRAAQFGTANASGGNRANQAAERALKSPLLRGASLIDAACVVVHIEAASELKFVELQAVMQTIAKSAGENVDLRMAVSLNEDLGEHLVVSVFATASAQASDLQRSAEKIDPQAAERKTKAAAGFRPTPEVEQATETPEVPEELFNTAQFAVAKDSAANSRRGSKPKQETLSLDPVARGRFEQSEPTIVGGEDLDVPAFLRQKIKLR